jgi:clan AA aspartic protease (TIGR02281 family)
MLGGYARWRTGRVSSEPQAQPDTEAVSAQEQRRIDAALKRVPLVNARANDLLRADNIKDALNLVDEVLAIVDAPDLLETKVNLLMKAKRYHEAYELLLLLLQKRDPPHLQFLAGQLAQTVKGAGEAMLHFSEAIRQEPQNKVYQLAWAAASFKAGVRDSSVAMFNRLVAEDPQCTPCWNEYAVAYYSSAEPDRAIAVWQQAVTRCPDNSTYHFGLARFLDRYGIETGNQSKLQEAAAQYRRSLELNPRKGSVAAARYYEITHQRLPPELENISADEIELEARGNNLVIGIKVNGVPGRFILDTGASFTSIHERSAARFGVLATSQSLPMQTANGVIQAPVAFADIQVGRHTISPSAVILIPSPRGNGEDGLLGMDSLRKLNAQIDSRRGRLVIQSDPTETLAGN